MAVVKIVNKENLDKLIAKLTLRIGRKPTQQEVIDLCVEMGAENFEKLADKLNPVPILDDQKIKDIIAVSEETEDIPWVSFDKVKGINKNDRDIYSL